VCDTLRVSKIEEVCSMGYTTEFSGKFDLNKPLDEETFTFLKKLANTRRVKRNVDPKYGVEGEFYVDGTGYMGQDINPSVIDNNNPPRTQPSLWCDWEPTNDRKSIEWNGAEKFYDYVEWIVYIIEKVLAPKGYVLNGEVKYRGESFNDRGTIVITNNEVAVA